MTLASSTVFKMLHVFILKSTITSLASYSMAKCVEGYIVCHLSNYLYM